MAMNLTNQVRSIAEVTKAVANGDLKKKIEVDVRGEMLDLKVRVPLIVLGGVLTGEWDGAEHGERDDGVVERVRGRGDACCA